MISIRWIAKDKNDNIWLFEAKPKIDEQLECWHSIKGEEWYDLDTTPLPLKIKKLLFNQIKRIPEWQNSLKKLDPNTWLVIG
jgi:hypothetical protein